MNNANDLKGLKVGSKVRWDEPLRARSGFGDIHPFSGEGVVVKIHRHKTGEAKGLIEGLVVAYQNPLAPAGMKTKAYYTAGFTKWELA